MFIRDSDQQYIEVTDLEQAISQAKMFVNLHHCDKKFKAPYKKLQQYWKDVLQKLIALKKKH